ncbi:UNVERIFIED_CONTAM: hypothetical protein FKN15_047883 [Acipenser sinensis]
MKTVFLERQLLQKTTTGKKAHHRSQAGHDKSSLQPGTTYHNKQVLQWPTSQKPQLNSVPGYMDRGLLRPQSHFLGQSFYN